MKSPAFTVALALAALQPSARGDVTLWYNGGFDGRDAFANVQGGQVADSRVYDDFHVTAAGGWRVSAVFSEDFVNTSGFTQAHWEIRAGVSPGNGGTIVAEGTGAAAGTNLGVTNSGLTEYRIEVAGLGVMLAPGTYDLSVAPVDPITGQDRFDIATTSGAGSVGSPPGNDGNSYVDSRTFAYNFAAGSDAAGLASPVDFSLGVVGVAVVPEPSGWAAMLAGLGTAAAFACARRPRPA